MSEVVKKNSTLTGTVTRDAIEKTIAVQITRKVPHPKYGKYIPRKTKLLVHDPNNVGKAGDIAIIKPVAPISKRKHHALVEILK
jgi:small subunit ribosomal protein S17